MARDRQRAKQRKRRQPGAGGPPAGSSRARARDARVEPTDAEQGSTPTPAPTEHAFPNVEEARMAEAGVPLESLEADVQVEPAADELDPSVYDERVEARPGRRKRGRILTFLGHVVDELRRVQWPDRRHTGQGTAVTLGFVVIAGAFLGLMDAIWKPLIEAIL